MAQASPVPRMTANGLRVEDAVVGLDAAKIRKICLQWHANGQKADETRY